MMPREQISRKQSFGGLCRVAIAALAAAGLMWIAAKRQEGANKSQTIKYKAPAGVLPIVFDGTPNATWPTPTNSLDFGKPDLNQVELRGAIQLSVAIPHRK